MFDSGYVLVSFIHDYSNISRRGSSFFAVSRGWFCDIAQTLNLRTSEKIPLASIDSDTLEGESGDSPDLDMLPGELQKPLPLRSVLTRPVVISVANYAMLALVNSVASSYFPLVWSTPVEFGGLNMDPPSIGVWLSLYGGVDGIFQILCFPLLVSRFGLRSVFVFAISSCIIIYAIFPLENIVQRMAGDGPNWAVWLLIILQLSALCVFDSGYGMFCIVCLSSCGYHDDYGISQVQCSYTSHVRLRTNGLLARWLVFRRW